MKSFWFIKTSQNNFVEFVGIQLQLGLARTPTKNELFHKEIQDIYFIDVKQDNEYIHAPYICFSKCESKVLRYQKQKKRQQHYLAGGSFLEGLPKDRTAVDWKGHGSDDKYGSCNVCQLGRSPRKKVILGHHHCYFVGASKKLSFDSDTSQNSSASTANSDKAKTLRLKLSQAHPRLTLNHHLSQVYQLKDLRILPWLKFAAVQFT